MKNEITNNHLFKDIQLLIEQSRSMVAQTVNSTLTALYWNIGKKINNEVLNNERAEYGKQIIKTLSKDLQNKYGKGWSEKQLRHCLYFVEIFPNLNCRYTVATIELNIF